MVYENACQVFFEKIYPLVFELIYHSSRTGGFFMMMEFNDFIFSCNARGLTPTTMKSYTNINKAFLLWVQEEYDISEVEEIKKGHIQKYIQMKMDDGRKEKYINGIIRTLRALFLFLEEEEYIQKNPMLKVKFIKETQNIIETYTDDEALALINAFDGDDYLSVRNRLMIALQLDTGIRCTETINIKLGDILSDRVIIHGKGKKIRTVPLSYKIYKMLKPYLKIRETRRIDEENKDYLFVSRSGRPLTVESIEHIYKRAKKIAKIKRKIRVSPHTSRHYYAVKMLENNDLFTVSKLLGHSSVKITEMYLRSVTTDKVIDIGRFSSPLTSMKNK